MSVFAQHNIAFIGFGEAASAFVAGWDVGDSAAIAAYDIKTDHADPAIAAAKRADYAACQVQGCGTLAEALAQAELVFSLVTADQAATAADNAARFIAAGAFYFDCNSCSPGTKRRNAATLHAAGARYVDVAVMAPVQPRRHLTPLALCGAHASDAKALFDRLGMNAAIVDGEVGAASTVKMVRSIMMKGLEALFAECVLSGRKAGVEELVLDSLDQTYPGFDFGQKAAYMLERAMTHGVRRAAEMREVARTVEELGLPGDMARATVAWQQRLGELRLKAREDEDYRERADRILRALALDEEAWHGQKEI